MQEQAVINGLEEARLGREGALFFSVDHFFFNAFDVHCTLRPIVCVSVASSSKHIQNKLQHFFFIVF